MTSDAEQEADRAAAAIRLSEDPEGITVISPAHQEPIDPDIRESTPEELARTP